MSVMSRGSIEVTRPPRLYNLVSFANTHTVAHYASESVSDLVIHSNLYLF